MSEQSKPLGEFICPKCGVQDITDAKKVTVVYPRGTNMPRAKVECGGCKNFVVALIEWQDAIIFDYAGANVEGFSFSRGPSISEKEIKAFMVNFDEKVDEFLDASKN